MTEGRREDSPTLRSRTCGHKISCLPEGKERRSDDNPFLKRGKKGPLDCIFDSAGKHFTIVRSPHSSRATWVLHDPSAMTARKENGSFTFRRESSVGSLSARGHGLDCQSRWSAHRPHGCSTSTSDIDVNHAILFKTPTSSAEVIG